MKNLIMILVMSSFLACEIVTNTFVETESIEIGKIENYNFENNIEISDYKEASDLTRNYIKYNKDKNEYWQSPEETYNSKTGDCEDYALFYSFLLDTKLHIDSEIIVYIDPHTDKLHSINYILSEDRYVDSSNAYGIYNRQFNSTLESFILQRIPYYEALWMTVNYHKPVGKYNL